MESFDTDTSAKIYIQSTYGCSNTYVSDSYVADVGCVSIGTWVLGKRKLFYLTRLPH